jgi:hypothetical protein
MGNEQSSLLLIISSGLQALATVILVCVTIYYAKQTHITVSEMVRTRELSVLPTVLCDLERVPRWTDASSSESFRGELNNVKVRNIGHAPAHDVVIHVDCMSEYTGWFSFARSEHTLFTLLEGAETIKPINRAFLVTDRPEVVNQPVRAKVTVTYENMFGVRFQTISLFEWLSDAPGRDVTNWTKYSEVVQVLGKLTHKPSTASEHERQYTLRLIPGNDMRVSAEPVKRR